MTKSLSERIAARAAGKKPSHGGQNRAVFLALRVDIKQALDDGWPIKSIWETLHAEKKIDFSYQAFWNYVNHLILSPPAPTNQVSDQKLNAKTTQSGQKPKTTEAPTMGGFTFNPTPNREDLI